MELGREAYVRTRCPVTGETVTLTVTPDGPRDVSPGSAVMSYLLPTGDWTDDVFERFCHYILLFASKDAGRQWVAEHPGTYLMSLDEAYELARLQADRIGAKRS